MVRTSFFLSTNLIKMRTLTWVVFLAFSIIIQQAYAAGCTATPGFTSGTLRTYIISGCTGNPVNTVSLVDNACTLLTYVEFSDLYVKITCSSGSYGLYYDAKCTQSFGTYCQFTCQAINVGLLGTVYSELTCGSLK